MLKANGTELSDESADFCLYFVGHVMSPAFGRVLNFCWNSRCRYNLLPAPGTTHYQHLVLPVTCTWYYLLPAPGTNCYL